MGIKNHPTISANYVSFAIPQSNIGKVASSTSDNAALKH